jgi:NTP pyrophosphatase (non-canonical NTP hydrolase)
MNGYFTKLQSDSDELEKLIISKSRTGKKDEVFVLVTHLLAECGEVADDIKGMEGKRTEDPSNYTKEELAKELVDVVFNTMRIANNYGISLDDYWDKRLVGIKNKFK